MNGPTLCSRVPQRKREHNLVRVLRVVAVIRGNVATTVESAGMRKCLHNLHEHKSHLRRRDGGSRHGELFQNGVQSWVGKQLL